MHEQHAHAQPQHITHAHRTHAAAQARTHRQPQPWPCAIFSPNALPWCALRTLLLLPCAFTLGSAQRWRRVCAADGWSHSIRVVMPQIGVRALLCACCAWPPPRRLVWPPPTNGVGCPRGRHAMQCLATPQMTHGVWCVRRAAHHLLLQAGARGTASALPPRAARMCGAGSMHMRAGHVCLRVHAHACVVVVATAAAAAVTASSPTHACATQELMMRGMRSPAACACSDAQALVREAVLRHASAAPCARSPPHAPARAAPPPQPAPCPSREQ